MIYMLFFCRHLNLNGPMYLSHWRYQVLNVIGDDVLKNVATRVSIEGAAPEGSPVEAPLIQIDNRIHTLDHADTREGQATCNRESRRFPKSV